MESLIARPPSKFRSANQSELGTDQMRTLGTRDRKTAHWLNDLAKLRAMESDRLDGLGAKDMEEGEIWERWVPPHILAEAAQSKDDQSRGCYGDQSDGSDIEYAW